jgi:ActR/RegA family two-component response regulator
MQIFLPYIITVLVAIITGYISYATATKKSKTGLEALRMSNQAEIEKLMSQHKLDLEALERKHEMGIEKMNLEHGHKLELRY